MTVKFYTLGCKVNQYETQAMKEAFIRRGVMPAQEGGADIVVINSCSVTAESDRKTRQTLGRALRENPGAAAVLTGCMVQAFPEDCKRLDADLIIGNKDAGKVVEEALKTAENKKREFFFAPHAAGDGYNTPGITGFDERTRAFMKIEDGCDRFCSYCVIPYARGRVRSRSIESVKAEAETLAKNGYREIVLVGINLSAYGKGETFDLCDAVDAVCAAEGVMRVRLGSLEPDHITDGMLARFGAQEKFCPQFHLSLQPGCDRTLKRMNRHYDAAFYLDLITRIRAVFPDAAVTTDVMVGFSGETEEDFAESVRFVKEAGFARVHVFPYSVRPGTAAASLPDRIPNAEKARRAKIMQQVAGESESAFLSRLCGKTVNVLFEKGNEGYTENYSRVVLKNESVPEGAVLKVRITEASGDHCAGVLA